MSSKWRVTLVLSAAICCVRCDELAFIGKLLLSHVVFRHGARSPIATYPSDPITEEQWGVKWGQLTKMGEEQQYGLGCYLRSRYSDFLPLLYSAEDVLVRSSDFDRALVSASLVMSGLYTPQAAPGQFANVYWQSVPLHTVPDAIDLLLPAFSSPCPAFQLQVDKVNSSIEYQCFKKQMSYLERFSSSASGASGMALYDGLKSKSYHGAMLPFWSRGVYPQPLSSYNDWNVYFGVASTAALRRMFVGRLMYEILENMEKKIEGTLQPDMKLFAYSGHDANMLALLSALHVWNGVQPPFSSCVLVELRLTTNHEHVVTVSYKNDTAQPPFLLQIPGCNSMACSFQEFVTALVSEVFDEAECYGKSEMPPQPLIFQLPTRYIANEWKQCFHVV